MNFFELLTDIREYDVPYHVRFCIDKGINASKWYKVSFGNSFVAGMEKLEEMSLLENFPKMFLGLTDVYDWQLDVLRSLDPKESRVALKAANGSGKTSVCVASAILWHMARFPGSLAVSTAGVWRQVEGQLWPCLKGYIRERLGEGWRMSGGVMQ